MPIAPDVLAAIGGVLAREAATRPRPPMPAMAGRGLNAATGALSSAEDADLMADTEAILRTIDRVTGDDDARRDRAEAARIAGDILRAGTPGAAASHVLDVITFAAWIVDGILPAALLPDVER